MTKIRPTHLQRKGVVYIRQSTPGQVANHLESQRRQYALPERLVAIGWPPLSIETIDQDQGHSAAQSHTRLGFERLVSEVALGHVGIILTLEISRLARNKEDLQHLMSICRVTDTLIGDIEGVYDLRLQNDRVLLGVKENYSEFELDILRGRMAAGAAMKASRGELILRVPVGYELSEEQKIEMTPNEAVRSAIAHVFARFRDCGSAFALVQALLAEGFQLPVRTDSFGRKKVDWRSPNYSAVLTLLRNPTYAGAYYWGRHHREQAVSPEGVITSHTRSLPLEQWAVLLKDHHPGYLTWEEFKENQRQLSANRRGFCHPGPAKEGPSILAGILRCERHGCGMHVSYRGKENRHPYFGCGGGHKGARFGSCQKFGATAVERRVTEVLLSILEPNGLEAVLLAVEDLEGQRQNQIHQWDLEVERATQVERRARAKHDEVEPGHRLVARELERKWEEALNALEESKRKRDRNLAQMVPPLTDDEKNVLRRTVAEVGKLWHAESTTWSQRKAIARLLIDHVDAMRDMSTRTVELTLHWTTGHNSKERVKLFGRGRPGRALTASDEEVIGKMAPRYTDTEIAATLSMHGRLTADGETWTAWKVAQVRKAQGWPAVQASKGEVSMCEAAKQLGVSQRTVKTLVARRSLQTTQAYAGARHFIPLSELERWRRKESMRA